MSDILIAVSSGHRPSDNGPLAAVSILYHEALERAGAVPVLLSPSFSARTEAALLSRVHGLVLTGGPDIEPARYGDERKPACGAADAIRDESDWRLARHCLEAGLPVLGICRGMQMLTVAAGGGLIQDIPSEVAGSLPHGRGDFGTVTMHRVSVVPGTLLARLLGSGETDVNSYHHQAAKAAPPGFAVTATAPDGVIEAIEHTQHPFCVGVQWHPERMAAADSGQQALFAGLVEAARVRAARGR